MADADLVERHRAPARKATKATRTFAPDILAAVRAVSRPDNWHGLDEIYRSLPLRRDQADTARVGVGA